MAAFTSKIKNVNVLKEVHRSLTGGHFGSIKTLQNVSERFYCNNAIEDMEK